MVEATGARPTHQGADDLFRPDIARKLKKKSENWEKLSCPLHYNKLCQRGVKAEDLECQEEEKLAQKR